MEGEGKSHHMGGSLERTWHLLTIYPSSSMDPRRVSSDPQICKGPGRIREAQDPLSPTSPRPSPAPHTTPKPSSGGRGEKAPVPQTKEGREENLLCPLSQASQDGG